MSAWKNIRNIIYGRQAIILILNNLLNYFVDALRSKALKIFTILLHSIFNKLFSLDLAPL
jgi:hypothetical protein